MVRDDGTSVVGLQNDQAHSLVRSGESPMELRATAVPAAAGTAPTGHRRRGE